VDDDQVNNDASRAPEPDNLTGAQAEAEPEANGTEAASNGQPATEAPADAAPDVPEGAEPSLDGAGAEAGPADERAAAEAAEAAEAEEVTVPEAEAAPGRDTAEAVATIAAVADDAGEGAEPAEQLEQEAAEQAAEDPQEAIVAELVTARAEAESYLDDLRRLQAEFDNYRKRTMREQTARIASASQALVAKLLPVLDNFELAVSHAEQSRDFDRMLKGVEMVFGELREVLSNEGLASIESEGKPFDPGRHEAVVAVELEGAEPGTVVDVIRKGYEFNGRVLRPAMVKVAR
jgi:molecular chaperone GrpE